MCICVCVCVYVMEYGILHTYVFSWMMGCLWGVCVSVFMGDRIQTGYCFDIGSPVNRRISMS